VTAASALPAGSVALVTGASRGIGRAIARRLAAQGAAVVVHASPRSQAGLDETVALVRAAGGRAAAVAADLADAAARATLLAAAAEPFGAVTVLVNNAAANPAYAPPSRIDLAARHTGFEVNFHAPVDLCQQALPAMKAAGWGRIVNLSSEMAQQPPIPYPGPAKLVHGLVLYGAAKAALERYTVGLAAELHGTGITANALLPEDRAQRKRRGGGSPGRRQQPALGGTAGDDGGGGLAAGRRTLQRPGHQQPRDAAARAESLACAGRTHGDRRRDEPRLVHLKTNTNT
jgi:NAD(P)-dependent dehydrogenase (short-subunit alcohol dehydrogenase family)